MTETARPPAPAAAAGAAAAMPPPRLDDGQTTSGGQMVQMLRFALGEQRCALRIDAVREILEVTRTTPLPLMPAFVRGVMNLRGAVVPVIDLGTRLGLPATQLGKRSCVVIVDAKDEAGGAAPQRLGLLVDAVDEVFDIDADRLEPVPRLGTRIAPSFIRAMTRVRGQVTPELNLETVLDAATLERLIARHAHADADAPAHADARAGDGVAAAVH